VLDGLVSAIDAVWTLLTLPARKWKWRMRGAAITMAAELRERERTAQGEDSAPYDLVFASTFVNLAEFRGLVGGAIASTPAIVYFHENQIAYPNQHIAEWDYQFPLTNITSALSAECCIFNSEWNRDGFLTGIDGFLREFPDHQPRGLERPIAEKSLVLAPPFDPSAFDALGPIRGSVPRIVWPHRWEHDKAPGTFFSAVRVLAEEGLDFEVAVAGQAFKDVPEAISQAESAIRHRTPSDRTAGRSRVTWPRLPRRRLWGGDRETRAGTPVSRRGTRRGSRRC
jgi:glycosyltransferase involved in cell wall biosynthesis